MTLKSTACGTCAASPCTCADTRDRASISAYAARVRRLPARRGIWTPNALALTAVLVIVALLTTGLPRQVAWLAAAALVLAVCLARLLRPTRNRPAQRMRRRGPQGANRFEQLLSLCHGDRALAERLVEGEARRNRGASRPEQIAAAVQRLRDDRSR